MIAAWLPAALFALIAWAIQRLVSKVALTTLGTRKFYLLSAVVSLVVYTPYLVWRPPAEKYEYQGGEAIASFLLDHATRRGANLKLVPTRANGQPAFGCYLPDAHAPITRAYGLMILTLTDDSISAITWFGERSIVPRFGLPRTLPEEE